MEQRILELVANNPCIQSIVWVDGVRTVIDDWHLLEMERTLTRELGAGELEVTPENRKRSLRMASIVF